MSRQAHAPHHASGFGLIAHGRRNPPLFARDHGPALEFRIAGLLAGRKKRIAVDVDDGARIAGDGEGLMVHHRGVIPRWEQSLSLFHTR